jgi:hypothetical protein
MGQSEVIVCCNQVYSSGSTLHLAIVRHFAASHSHIMQAANMSFSYNRLSAQLCEKAEHSYVPSRTVIMNTYLDMNRPLTPAVTVADEEVLLALQLAASLEATAGPLPRSASPLIFGARDSDGEPEIVYTDTRSHKAQVQLALDLAAVFPESLRLKRLFRHFEAWHHTTITERNVNDEERNALRLKQRFNRWTARWDSKLYYSQAATLLAAFLSWKAAHFRSKTAASRPTSMPSPTVSQAWDIVRKAANSVKEGQERRDEEVAVTAFAFCEELTRRWLARRAVAMFDLWKIKSIEKKYRTSIFLHIVRRLKFLRLHKSFQRWTIIMSDQSEVEFNLLKRSQTRIQLSVVLSWHQYCVRRTKNHFKSVGATWRIRYTLMKKTFFAWKRSFQNWSNQKFIELRKKRTLYKVTAIWSQRSLATSFSGWHENACQRRCARSVCQKVVRRMLGMKVAAAFEGWRGSVRELRLQRAIVLRAAKRIQVGVCGAAFMKWVDAAAELRREREEHEAAVREAAAAEARKHAVLSRVARVWSQRSLATSFSGWHENACQRRCARSVCQKVVRRMLGMKVAAAFEGWRGSVRELRLQRAIVLRAAKRIQVGVCGAAFMKWVDAAAELRREREEHEAAVREAAAAEARKHAVLSRVARVWSQRSLATSFSGWHENACQRRCARSVCQKVVHRMLGMKVAAAFEGWRGSVRELRLQRAIVLRAAKRIQVGVCGAAFMKWVDAAAELRREREEHEAAVREAAAAEARKHAVLSRVARVWSQRSLATSFSGWHENACQRRCARSVCQKVVRRMLGMKVAAAFEGWRGSVRELRLQRAIVLRAAKRIQVGVCGAAFMKWVDAAAELRREREEHEAAVREAAAAEARKHAVLSRVARVWSQRSLATSFSGWHENACQRRCARSVCQKVVRRMLGMKVAAAFEGWRGSVRELRLQRAIVLRAAKRIQVGVCGAAFMKWVDAAAELRREREEHEAAVREAAAAEARKHAVLSRVARVWSQRSLATSFSGWHENACQRRCARSVCQKVVRRMLGMKVAAAFEGWRGSVRELRLQRAIVLRAAKRIQVGVCGAAFMKWVDAAAELRREREEHEAAVREAAAAEARKHAVLSRVARVWSQRSLATSFSGWHENACQRRCARSVCQKVVRRMLGMKVAAAFEGWRGSVRELRLQRAIVLRAAKRIQVGVCGAAFMKWVDAAAELRREREEHEAAVREAAAAEARKHAVLSRVARVWSQRSLATSFSGWHENACQRRCARSVCQKVVRRMLGMKVAAAFEGWRGSVRELRLQRAIVLRAAKRIQVGVCGAAFMKWVDAAAELRREREEHEAAVREAAAAEARKHAVLSRVARVWSQRSLATSFSGWHENACQRRCARSLCQKVVRRMLGMKVAAAFEGWRGSVRELRLQRAIVLRAAKRIQVGVCGAAFMKWVDAAAELRREREEHEAAVREAAAAEARKHAVLSRVARVWSQRSLATSFSGWHENACQRRCARSVCQKVVRRMLGMKVAAAFEGWRGSVRELRLQRAIVLRAAKRIQVGVCGAAFMKWVDAAAELRREREEHEAAVREAAAAEARKHAVLSRVARVWSQRSLATSFSGWHENACQRRCARSVCQKVVRRMLGMKVAAAFEGWRGSVRELRLQRAIVLRAAKRIQVGVCGAAFMKWVDAAAELRREREEHEAAVREAAAAEARKHAVLSRVARVWSQRSLATSFSGWHENACQRRCARSVCQKVVRRMLGMKVAAAFEGWRGSVRELRLQRAIVLRAAKRIQVGVCGAAFMKWVDAAAELRREREEHEAAVREAAAAEARKHAVLSRVARVWSQRSLATSFSGWHENACQRRCARSVCQKVVRRMLGMKVAAAFEGWRGSVRELRLQRAIVLRAAKRIQVGVCGAAFMKWVDAAAELRREREEHEAAVREAAAAEARKHAVLSRVARVWSQRSLATSFSGWHENACQRRCARSVCQKVVRRMLGMKVAAAFEGWRGSVRELRLQRAIVLRAAKRIQVGVCGAAFMKWVDAAAELRRDREKVLQDKVLRDQLYSHARLFRRCSCVRLVFRYWSQFIFRLHPREIVIRSCSFRFQSLRTLHLILMFRCFNHWHGLVVSKLACATACFRRVLLQKSLKHFTCLWLRRRSRTKELMLACTLLDHVSSIPLNVITI